MTTMNPIFTVTVAAAGSILAERFVNALGVLCGLGEAAMGVARNAALATELFPLDVLGTANVVAGCAVTNGQLVMSDDTGRAIPLMYGYNATGIARSAATAAGQTIEVYLLPEAGKKANPNTGFALAAGGAVTAKKFITAGGVLAVGGGATLGIVQETGDEGDPVNCIVSGISPVLSGGQFAAGDTLMCDGTSRAVLWTPNHAKSAIALESASAAGETVNVLVLPNTLPATALSALTAPLTASGAITKDRFVTAAGAVAGAGANVVGVAAETVAQGATFTAGVAGVVTVDAGGEVAVDAVLKSDADGKAVTWAVSGAKVARALTAAAAEDDKILVLLLSNV